MCQNRGHGKCSCRDESRDSRYSTAVFVPDPLNEAIAEQTSTQVCDACDHIRKKREKQSGFTESSSSH